MSDILMAQELLKKYLPEHEITYCETESHEILGLKFQSSGVAVKLQTGLEFFGASSSEVESPLVYAAYECLERYAILSQKQDVMSFETDTFKAALSNGVAIHQTHLLAKQNAYYELLERNEILKSWFFNTPITHYPPNLMGSISSEIEDIYDFAVVDFSTQSLEHVIGVFALPRTKEVNLIYGFGSSSDFESALKKAKKEFVTRLGFLWGESHDENFSNRNTSNFHQEFYLRHENLIHIREWLFGTEYPKMECTKFQLKNVNYVNITPKSWGSELSVTRVLSTDAIPLFFGLPPKHLFDFSHRSDIPHPIV